jgi:L-alanine-DL-glutamate epimerase-like enolase superfamily enzyme
MARGWESKSVEEQVAEKESARVNPDEVLRIAHMREARQQRERQALELQRERVLSERTSNPNRRAALEAALVDIEGKLKAYS